MGCALRKLRQRLPLIAPRLHYLTAGSIHITVSRTVEKDYSRTMLLISFGPGAAEAKVDEVVRRVDAAANGHAEVVVVVAVEATTT